MEVKKSQHKYVIGPKGNSLQEILERTGVSVEIPPSDSISETVILRGEPEKLGQALTEVYAKVTAFRSESQLLLVGLDSRMAFLGPRGHVGRAARTWSPDCIAHHSASWFPRPTVLLCHPSLLPPGFTGSSSARKGRIWPKSLSRCPR